jgi:pimeloyl-ACP methyl ester carboxylesterase
MAQDIDRRSFLANVGRGITFGFRGVAVTQPSSSPASEPPVRPKPFRIQVDATVLQDLQQRLQRTRWPDEFDNEDWRYGTNGSFLKGLIEYWSGGFDWRAQERALNEWSHFVADVDGQLIHFVHVRGRGTRPLPIIVTHGWPSTFAELLPLAERLADPGQYGGDPQDSFDVVVPSLPGFGFSPLRAGPHISRSRVSELWRKLMTDVLGYPSFVAHGGDIGAGITSRLAFEHERWVIAIHLTAVRDPYLGPGAAPLSVREQQLVAAMRDWDSREGGYAHIQGTRPQTLAFGLNDSPAALAAWIVDKFRSWSDCGGDIERCFTKDQLLTTIMIYWATATMNSAMRYYFQSREQPWTITAQDRIHVPTGVAIFPKDLSRPPREWAKRFYDVQHWTEMPRGGHFAALEQTDLLANDLRTFFRRFRSGVR